MGYGVVHAGLLDAAYKSNQPLGAESFDKEYLAYDDEALRLDLSTSLDLAKSKGENNCKAKYFSRTEEKGHAD